ncbi:hypothetical protein ACIRD3_32205 [Kitasatospora sp. NPDC093550]|uniref:hypothetical protein n=1 Tax=Kitasatospora sp. NPDC093550 TaxID=3364089 RepID=UPI0037FE397A
MTGIEIAVGYVFAWAVRKAGRVAHRADAEVDRGLDAGMDRLHDLVSRKLSHDSSLQRLHDEAAAGHAEPTARTRQRLELALEDAAEHDAEFADALQQAVDALRVTTGPSGGVSADGGGQAVGGNAVIRADHGSVAALRTGDVTIGNPPQPGAPQD